MRARVEASIRIDRTDLPAKLLEQLRRALSFPNPAYLDRLRLGLHPGPESERLCFVEERGGEVRLPRGAIHTLRELAERDGVSLDCLDERLRPVELLPEVREPALRDYQAAAVERFVKVTQGTAVIPCGGGKTRVGIGAIARLRTPALVLVHTLDLADQWCSEVRGLLGIEAGTVGDGECAPAPVTVAVIQALARWSPAQLEAFLGRFGMVILDEAHHVAASTFRDIIGRCPARYRLGLTATPEREDGLTPLLELYFGPRVAAVTHEELVAAGVLVVPEIRMVPTTFTYDYGGAEDYAPMLAALVADEARNALVVDTVAAEARSGHVSMVLSGRVDHCEALVERLVAAGVSAALLAGPVKKDQRRRVLDDARAGRLAVVVATSLADEGLDLPRLSRVFLVYPGRARGRTVQRLGRLMRPHPDKAGAVLFDFVDRRVPILRRHHLERRCLYAEILGVPASRLGSAGPARA